MFPRDFGEGLLSEDYCVPQGLLYSLCTLGISLDIFHCEVMCYDPFSAFKCPLVLTNPHRHYMSPLYPR